jgi:DNA repair ATPase RecN
MNPQHVLGLVASNLKRITAVEIKLDKTSGTVIVAGENGAGKSSVLDAICAACGGAEYKPDQPVRIGKNTAKIVLKTEDLVVTRKFSADGRSVLEITNHDGLKYQKPQDLLDKLISRVGFDPFSFSQMEPKKQTAALLAVCPVEINLEENAQFFQGEYQSRRDVNRDIKALEAQLGPMLKPDASIPSIEVSIAALSKELSDLQGQASAKQKWIDSSEMKRGRITALNAKIKELQTECESFEKEAAGLDEAVAKSENVSEKLTQLQNQIESAEATNSKVRELKRRADIEIRLAAAKGQAEKHENNLTKLAKAKEDALNKANFPVPGLTIDGESQLLYNNVLLSQASSAEKIRIGIAIAAAASPTLKVCFIRDGSLLDKKSMAAIEEMAQKNGLQIWIERVEDNSPAAIQIVEGSNIGAKDAPDEAPPEKTESADDDELLDDKQSEAPVAVATKKKKKSAGPDLFRG